MRVLLTGTSGMLGSELKRSLSLLPGISVYSTSRQSEGGLHKVFDLADTDYEELLAWSKPDVIVHSAALTKIEECESQQAIALNVNTDSVEKFLSGISKSHCKFFFISTDAVKSDGQA